MHGMILLAFATSCSAPQDKDPVPQAKPIITLLKAVKDGNAKALKDVFSKRMREQYDQKGWDKVLEEYRGFFKKEFGDYTMDDFTFEFAGREDKGKVSVVYKGKKMPGLRVVKEEGGWKMNER